MVMDALLVRDHGEALSEDIRAHAAECSQCDRAVRHLGFLEENLRSIASETLEPPPFQSVARNAYSAASGRRRRRAMRRAFPFALAISCAAAATAGMIALVHRLERPKIAVAGEVLDASRGTVQALLADGAKLTLGTGRVVIRRSERQHGLVRLEVGSVFVEVPHREKGATFVLETQDADVHVQGTRFDVSRGPEGTRVRVSEGMVTVRPHDVGQKPISVAKGETTLVEGATQLRSRQLFADLDALDNSQGADGVEVRIRQLLNDDPTVAGAGEAYARLAWRLSATGRIGEAIDDYRRALSFPTVGDPPLWADNAAAQLALVLERNDPAGAVAAWHEYVGRFPGGVHAEMARLRIAGKGAPRR
jgi:ferric-dicitrate binding protein FerR (iron transport regulator)